jgi:hypothetical protein
MHHIVCLLVYSRTSNFSAIWRLSPLPVTGLQILAYARHSGPLSREGSLSCHTYCDTGPPFIRSHPKDRHPCPTVGFEPPTQGSSDLCARRSNHCATPASHYRSCNMYNKLNKHPLLTNYTHYKSGRPITGNP